MYLMDYGMGGDKVLPFDVPGLPEMSELNLTDALVGAMGGKVALDLGTTWVESRYGKEKSDMARIGLGVLSFLGLAFVERLQESSLFQGFAIMSMANALSPLSDWVSGMALGLGERVTGSMTGRRLGQNSGAYRGWNRRIGVSYDNVRRGRMRGPIGGMTQGGTSILPNIQTPRSLITAGSNVRTRSRMSGGAAAAPKIGKDLQARSMFQNKGVA